MAMIIVNIIGTAIKRTPKPSNKAIAPITSAPMAKIANRNGNGNPKPQSSFPNHYTILSKPSILCVPAIQKIGTKYKRINNGARKSNFLLEFNKP